MSGARDATTDRADINLPYRAPSREVARALGTDPVRGLTEEEAATRLREIGRNVIDRRERWLLRTVGRRLFNVLTLILLGAAVVSALLGDVIDAVLISIVVALDFVVGLFYESYAQYKIELIRQQAPRIAEALRGGRPRLLPVEELVPGDLVTLRRGERIPADARLTNVQGLAVDEAILTGEPGDTGKTIRRLDAPAATADQRNMVFAGTMVTVGSGQGVVVATGSRSVLGALARRVVEAGWQVTPLEARLRSVGQLLGAGILCVAALLFVLGLARGEAPAEMFRAALTLAVAAIPEDLTFVLTVALAVGATRLLSRRAVVRHLTAAETLGDATVVATDKTGTLTTGALNLRRVEGIADAWNASAAPAASAPLLFRRALIGAVIGMEGSSEETLRGSAIERALRAGVRAAGIDTGGLRREYPLYASLAFDPLVRYHASLHGDPASPAPILFVVGAPEALLPHAVAASGGATSLPLAAEARAALLERAAAAAAGGTRVLAVCARHLDRSRRALTRADINELAFLAFLFFDDPLRPDAADAVRGLQDAGVRVLLLTGDHPGTAAAVAAESGILRHTSASVLEGAHVDRLTDALLAESLHRGGVAARVDPLQKERIISVLQQRGEVVAMLGDGVNDAVALRRADLGIAVSTATDVAKDASDLILLDGGLSVLTTAVAEGRRVRETVRTVLVFLFSTNLTEILAVTAALLLAVPLPFLPAQLLWVNVVTDGTADIALALEPAATRTGEARPWRTRGIFRARDLLGMFFAAVVLLLPTMIVYLAFLRGGGGVAHARTAAFVTLAAGQLFSAFSYRSLDRSIFRLAPLSNPWLLAAEALSFALLVAAVHWPPLAALLGTTPLARGEWALLMFLALLGALGVESRKLLPFLAEKPPRAWERAALAPQRAP